MADKREIGRKYENMAVRYLMENGYDIIERNYQNRYGEIDIIAGKEGILVACEVKYRSGMRCGDPLEAVDLRKQRRICRTMLYYYKRHGYSSDMPCRFDVVAVYADDTIKHLQNAFEFRI